MMQLRSKYEALVANAVLSSDELELAQRSARRKNLDLETQLKAGTLLYYKDGAPATVSVKRLTGTTTLAVDSENVSRQHRPWQM